MSPIRMERIESAVRVVLAFYEAFNRHDITGMMALMTGEVLFENAAPAPDGKRSLGKAAVTQFWEDFFREAPQAHIQIEEIFGIGLRCVVRWRYDWEEAAGAREHLRGMDIFQVKDGLISEKLSYVKG
jgi:predicted SnoaL-like aldol condensation-catalyzing enzyme